MLRKDILEQLVASDATWVEGSFALQTGGNTASSSLLVNINIRAQFFDANVANSEEVLVDGQVKYSRTSEAIDADSVYVFQLSLPIKNTQKAVKVVNNEQDDQEAIAKATKEEQEKRRKFNLRLWTPIAVVLALLIMLAIKLVVDLRSEQ